MDALLPQAYLIGLVVILSVAAVAVGRQVWRVRRDELSLARLERQGAGQGGSAADLYELGSAQLRKRLYGQATDTLKQALKKAQGTAEPAEAMALIENALGFALAAQNNYKAAIPHYRKALSAKADYPVALNNLAFALEKQRKTDEAREVYEQALALDPSNKTAQKRLNLLGRRQAA
ncbi:MAG: tetratricopeptide repeat protein [Cyanobacteriota bacterium]|nr:tetratricopeptide repeat protein [Cyanobacteriota bacterium]